MPLAFTQEDFLVMGGFVNNNNSLFFRTGHVTSQTTSGSVNTENIHPEIQKTYLFESTSSFH